MLPFMESRYLVKRLILATLCAFINFKGNTNFNQATLNLRAKNIHINFQGASTFENNSTMNLTESSQASFNTLSVEGETISTSTIKLVELQWR